jgi:hypothetical protein
MQIRPNWCILGVDICPPFYWYSGVTSPVIVLVTLLRLPDVPPHVRLFLYPPQVVGYNNER